MLAGSQDDAANGRNFATFDEEVANNSGANDDGWFAQNGSSKRPFDDGPPHGEINKFVIVGMRAVLNFLGDGIVGGACVEQGGIDVWKQELEFAPAARKKCVWLLEVRYASPAPMERFAGIGGDMEGITVEEEYGVIPTAETESRSQSRHPRTHDDDLHGRKL